MDDATRRAYGDLDEVSAKLVVLQQELAQARTVATSRDRGLTVAVDASGAVVEIKFLTKAYRTMAGAELAALLVETIDTARDQARSAVTQSFQDLLPDLSIDDIVAGYTDPAAAVRDLSYRGDE